MILHFAQSVLHVRRSLNPKWSCVNTCLRKLINNEYINKISNTRDHDGLNIIFIAKFVKIFNMACPHLLNNLLRKECNHPRHSPAIINVFEALFRITIAIQRHEVFCITCERTQLEWQTMKFHGTGMNFRCGCMMKRWIMMKKTEISWNVQEASGTWGHIVTRRMYTFKKHDAACTWVQKI